MKILGIVAGRHNGNSEILVKEDPHMVGGLIAVGGSCHDWQTLALEGMGATMFTQSVQVVDRCCPQETVVQVTYYCVMSRLSVLTKWAKTSSKQSTLR